NARLIATSCDRHIQTRKRINLRLRASSWYKQWVPIQRRAFTSTQWPRRRTRIKDIFSQCGTLRIHGILLASYGDFLFFDLSLFSLRRSPRAGSVATLSYRAVDLTIIRTRRFLSFDF